MFNKTIATGYDRRMFGAWGQFSTASGRVDYIAVKARLGLNSTDAEHRLTRELSLVREVIPSEGLGFDQLLQRDLDDHRVAQFLVPYLLEQNAFGPAFFPPVVAVLLPFHGKDPQDNFPEKKLIEKYCDELGYWDGYSHDKAFKFEKLIFDSGADHEIKLGRLSWNPEYAKLVVIDGQHRAMALLAIDRTVNNTWDDYRASKYRCFYEPVIEKFLKEIGKDKIDSILSTIELPVHIVWFPTIRHNSGSYQKVARKLFVDVNKNAKPPSYSRTLLLSDGDLASVFTRMVLNSFRSGDSDFPIYAVEYDHPSHDQVGMSKWSAITNVVSLSTSIQRSLWGPARYINDVTKTISGKDGERKADDFFRSTLDLERFLPASIENDGSTFHREKVGRYSFPQGWIKRISDEFLATWGSLIVKMYEELPPFSAHSSALKELKEGWATPSAADTLAKDAVFDGVGIYWTLRDGFEHWQSLNSERQSLPPIGETDVVKAWKALEYKKAEFAKIRSKYFLGSDSQVKDSEAAFAIYQTNACQIGFILAVRTLASKLTVKSEDLPSFIDDVLKAAILSFKSGPKSGRHLFLARRTKDGHNLNQITKLDTPMCVYFRYFWLELLLSTEAKSVWKLASASAAEKCRNEARLFYLDYLIAENFKSLRLMSPSESKEKLEREAFDKALISLVDPLHYWFGYKKGELREEFKRHALSKRDRKSKDSSTEQEAEPEAEVADQPEDDNGLTSFLNDSE